MADLLAGIPILGGFLDDSDEKMLAEYAKNRALYNNLELPEYEDYKPEEYKYLGEYSPETALATQASEDPAMRSAQLSALGKLSGLSDTGLSEVDALGFANARDLAARESRGQRAAALQNAQARGVAGGGLEFALGEIGNQGAANRAAQAARETAAESARQRALYNQAYGNALSGMRDQDYRAERGNVDILNQFNLANTQARNQAQQYNVGQRQNTANMNTQERNSAQKYGNEMAQQSYRDRLTKVGGQAGVNTQMADYYGAEEAANRRKRAAGGQAIGTAVGYGLGGPAGGKVGGMIGGGLGGAY